MGLILIIYYIFLNILLHEHVNETDFDTSHKSHKSHSRYLCIYLLKKDHAYSISSLNMYLSHLGLIAHHIYYQFFAATLGLPIRKFEIQNSPRCVTDKQDPFCITSCCKFAIPWENYKLFFNPFNYHHVVQLIIVNYCIIR